MCALPLCLDNHHLLGISKTTARARSSQHSP